MAADLAKALETQLAALEKLSVEELLQQRTNRLSGFGVYSEGKK